MSRTLTVLVAEDSQDDVFLLRRALGKSDAEFDLHFVQDGQQLIDYINGEGPFADRERNPLPEMVVLDLKMPRKDGFETLEWLQSRWATSGFPTLVLSNSTDSRDVSRAYALGASGYLLKPCAEEGVDKLVGTFERYWRILDQFLRPPDDPELKPVQGIG
jgi:CheY-like chemotaxis protein